MNRKKNILARLVILAAVLTLASTPVLADATIIIVNADGPNEGFNDPTPVAPVGGNPGTTRGQQRLNAFQFAADIWGSTLDSSIDIFVIAAFNPLGPNVLGSAGTTYVVSDFGGVGQFPGSEFPDTWYHGALADKRAGFEFNPGAADISAQFSSNFNFYLGLDNNHGALNDLVAVVLHELAHGLGFANFVNEANGANFLGQTDIYSQFTLDDTNGLHWSVMTAPQRQASAINARHVVWDGSAVTAAVPTVLSLGVPQLVVNSPAAIAGTYPVGTASFGPPLSASGLTGNVVLALDPSNAAGPLTTDACSPLTNAAAVAGNIAIVDRGTCTFTAKAANVQAAGARAMIVADNAPGNPPAGLGGVDPTITIPSVRVTQANGASIKANLPANVTLGLNLAQRAGANSVGLAQLWAVDPVAPGSSISHWDVIAFPNQLMEPAINPDLTHSVQPPEDLTLPQMRDVGWFPDADFDGVSDDSDECLGSNLAPTVVIDGCDSGVPNTLLASGCTITDLVLECAVGAGNHGAFVSCATRTLNELKKAGIITGEQKEAIQSCASGANIP